MLTYPYKGFINIFPNKINIVLLCLLLILQTLIIWY